MKCNFVDLGNELYVAHLYYENSDEIVSGLQESKNIKSYQSPLYKNLNPEGNLL